MHIYIWTPIISTIFFCLQWRNNPQHKTWFPRTLHTKNEIYKNPSSWKSNWWAGIRTEEAHEYPYTSSNIKIADILTAEKKQRNVKKTRMVFSLHILRMNGSNRGKLELEFGINFLVRPKISPIFYRNFSCSIQTFLSFS